jgi:hypothetical protein
VDFDRDDLADSIEALIKRLEVDNVTGIVALTVDSTLRHLAYWMDTNGYESSRIDELIEVE